MFEGSVETPLPPDPPGELVSAISSRTGPSYVNVKALSSYPNLRLLSNDGSYYEVNRCVFAAVSPMLNPAKDAGQSELSEDALDIDLSITTDLNHNELQIAVE